MAFKALTLQAGKTKKVRPTQALEVGNQIISSAGEGLTIAAASGSVAFGSAIDMGSNNITTSGTIDGKDVSTLIAAISEASDTSIAAPASGHLMIYDGTDSWDNKAVSGDITLSSTGVAAIAAGVIVDADISASAEIAVSKLADGAARQVLQTDAAGTGVEWTDNLDLPGTLDVTGAATFDAGVSLGGAISGAAFLDDDTFATATATTLASAESIKAYVDSQVGGIDTFAELTDTNIAAPASGHIAIYDGTDSWDNKAVSGDITLSSAGVAAISAGVVVNADISATAEIAVSKLADGAARQLLQTDAAGTGVEWTDNVDVPGTLDVTGQSTMDTNLEIAQRIGVGNSSNIDTAANADYSAHISNDFANGDSDTPIGLFVDTYKGSTTGDPVNTGAFISGVVDASNTQDWTNPTALQGCTGYVGSSAGSTGAITGATCFKATAYAGGATFTSLYGLKIDAMTYGTANNYGIYIGTPSGGSGNNDAIHALGGRAYFGGTFELASGVAVSAVLDEDNFASNSDTSLATQQSIKAYVDTEVAKYDTFAELTDTNIATPAAGHIAIYDGTDSWDNKEVTGDVTITAGGVTAISAGVIVDADVSATAAIAVSKLADGASRQLLQTNLAGDGVEWTDNVDVPGTLDVTGAATFDAGVSLGGAISGAAFLDDDSFATATATTLASAESIKAYVDAQIGGSNSFASLTDTTIATPTSGQIAIYDGTDSWDNKSVSGDITIASTGVAAIASGVIVNADISASAAVAVSKLGNGTARQLLQTNAAGTGVEWTDNVDVPGTLDVTGAANFDSTVKAASRFAAGSLTDPVANTSYAAHFSEEYINDAGYPLLVDGRAARTDADTSQVHIGSYLSAYVGATNDKNWTSTVGVIGLGVNVGSISGSTGTITGAAGIQVDDAFAGGATISNFYGVKLRAYDTGTVNNYALYIDAPSGGSGNNDSIHVTGGRAYFGGTLELASGVAVSAVLDEDDLTSDSDTALATQQSIKAYVDAQVATHDTFAELTDTNIATPASGHIAIYDGTDSWDNKAMSGDVTMIADGTTSIASGVITNTNISATAEISVSKLADGAARQVLQTDLAGTGVEWTDNLDLPGTLDVTGAATFDAGVSLGGAISGAAFLDDDTFATATATTLASAESIKAYVDSQVGGIDTFAELDDTNISTPTSGQLAIYDGTDSWDNKSVGGDISLAADGTASIASGVIVDADVSATAEIAVSKLADGDARQLLQTNAAGDGVEWASNIDVPGTLDVTGVATFDGDVGADTEVRIGNSRTTYPTFNIPLLVQQDVPDGATLTSQMIASWSSRAHTSAASTDSLIGVEGWSTVHADNTQNWTNTFSGLTGIQGSVGTQTDSTGVVTHAAAFRAAGASASGATITNNYGMKVEAQTAATNNYGVWVDTPTGTIADAFHAVGGRAYFGGTFELASGVAVSAVLDEDDLTSDSDTALATQQSIKAYVDAQVATHDTFAELTDTNIATPAAGHIAIYDGTDSWDNKAVSGDITLSSAGVAAISSGVIVDADVSATAEIAVSKLADGDARQLLQTDAAGTGVEWASNIDVPGTLDVTGLATLDGNLDVNGVSIFGGKYDDGIFTSAIIGAFRDFTEANVGDAINAYGAFTFVTREATTGAITGDAVGMHGAASVKATNTQNWTGSGTDVPLCGVRGSAETESGATGTIAGAACFEASGINNLGSGTITNAYGMRVDVIDDGTNNYGVYIDTPTGGTINDAIHAAGGRAYFGGTFELASGVAVSAVLDEDAFGSDSATALATQQSIKAYVDAQIGGSNSFSSLTDTNIATPAAGHIAIYDGTDSWDNKAVSGDITIASTGVAAIAAGVIVDADVSATAEIAVSKLADGAARQILQTDAAGSGVEWTDNLDIPGTLDVTGAATFDAGVSLGGAISGAAFLDDDTFATATATTLASAESIKAYVDTVAAATDTFAELDDTNISGPASGQIAIYDGTDSWDNKSVSGDITLSAAGVAAIASGVVVNADINASAAIAVSKLADGDARQLLQTNAGGTAAEWASNIDVPGTLDVTGVATLDNTLSVAVAAGVGNGLSGAGGPSAAYPLLVAQDNTDAASGSVFGGYISNSRIHTTAASTDNTYGLTSVASVGPTNTQNWTSSSGSLVGISANVWTQTGSTGVVSNASGIEVNNANVQGATITNNRGIHVYAQTGGTNNYGVYIETPTGTISDAIHAVGGRAYFGGTFELASGAAVSAILDEDAFGSDSDTALATQQSIKAYVDSQVGGIDTFAELNDTNIATPAAGHVAIYDGTDSWDNKAVSGDITLASDGTAAIASGVIVNADVSATAGIAVSKLADGDARQLLQTNVAGDGVEWASNIDVPGTLDVTGAATFDAGVSFGGAISGASFLDDDTFATATATTLASAESIKAYVDTQVAGIDTFAELSDTNIATPAAGHVAIYDGTDSWDNKPVSGDITLSSAGVAAIASGVIVNADVSATAEILVSKLANGTARQLVQTDAAGTGVEWASNIDVPGTLDVTGAATFDAGVSFGGAISGASFLDDDSFATATATTLASAESIKAYVDAQIGGSNSFSSLTDTDIATPAAGHIAIYDGTDTWDNQAVSGDITLASDGTVAIASAVIVDADISATAEIAVSKLADGSARQLLQTDAAGTGVEWASNVDVPGTLDVTGAATFDSTGSFGGAVDMNSNKITELAAGTTSGDALVYGQSGVSLTGLTVSTTDISLTGGATITGVPDPTNSTDAANKNYVDNQISGLQWKDSALCLHLVGNDTVSNINGLSPTAGQAYVVTDSGTITSGSISANAGDIVEYDGAQWVRIEQGSGGFVLAGIRAILTDTAALTTPYTNGTDNDKVVSFSGSSNTGTDTGEAVDSAALLIQDPAHVGYYDNLGYVYEGTAPPGTWVQFTGAGTLVDGDGLLKTGNILSVRAGDGIQIASDYVAVELGTAPGLELTGSTPNKQLVALLDPTTPGLQKTNGLKILLDPSEPGLQLTSGLKVLLASSGGLELSSGLKIDLDTNPGLVLGAGGIKVDLDTSPGLELGAGGLKVDVRANEGLSLDASGLGTVIEANKGLTVGASGFAAVADTANAIQLSGSGIGLNFTADKGLHIVSNALEIELASANELSADSDGLHVEGVPAQFKVAGNAVATTVTQTAMDTVMGDGTASAEAYHTHGIVGVADEALVAGNVVCFDDGNGDGNVALANATVATSVLSNAAGFSVGAASATAACTIRNSGEITIPDALWAGVTTPIPATEIGKRVYLSETAGSVTHDDTTITTSGAYILRVGTITYADGSSGTTRIAISIGEGTII